MIALITGGSKNIGAASARYLARDGFDVVIHTGSDTKAAESVARDVESFGRRAHVVVGDLRDRAFVAAMKQEILRELGPVSVLVNNAAVRPDRPFLEMTDEDWRDVVGLILDAAFYCCREFIPDMVDAGWGRVINMIGVRGEEGEAGRVHVCSAKNGLIGMTRALAHEFGRQGITVNAISPGTIATDRDRRDPSRLERRAHVRVTSQPGESEDIAAMVALLAGDSGKFITGQVVGINGGERMT
jgi:3-oxoacyl-[acyl-carrier protein] reductase